jgi:fatty-acyl-CoA synthase
MRAQLYMRGFAAATESKPEDRIYIALPLYHATGGLCGVGAALLNGASIVLKRKFSASQFWEDVIGERCTMFVYIGELCRYLVNQPERPEERMHKLRLAFGNGLRPDVWERMVARFRIPRILEFYGATEGNVSILNFDGKLGAVGRIPSYVRSRFNVRLARFDVETEQPMRGPDGLCMECKPGEVGGICGATRCRTGTSLLLHMLCIAPLCSVAATNTRVASHTARAQSLNAGIYKAIGKKGVRPSLSSSAYFL